jgi:A/G-specific adenine glycosylase
LNQRTPAPLGGIAVSVLRWQKAHGRHDLPWQANRDPYHVWLSEIMLQQTQVASVLAYFSRFLQRFPTLASLASASQDDVLALWSGLGYYSRARNLHLCAQQVMDKYDGEFPSSAKQLQTLPGIGRSTAAAVAALCFGERVAILDGNVKRVLTRVLGFDLDLANAVHERQLWERATQLLPERDLQRTMPRYTQGMMDLGATLCTVSKPACERCPLSQDCVALRQGKPQAYPVKTRKLKRSAQSIWLLWLQTPDGSVALSKRPTPGVWAGLQCFPLFDSRDALEASMSMRQRKALQDLPVFTHVLTHKDLHLHPVKLQLSAADLHAGDARWFHPEQWADIGLPAPIRKLLMQV